MKVQALQQEHHIEGGRASGTGHLVEHYEYTPYGQRTVYSHGGWSLCDLDDDGDVDDNDTSAFVGALAGGPAYRWVEYRADIDGDGECGGDDIAPWNAGAADDQVTADAPVLHATLHSARGIYAGDHSYLVSELCEFSHQGLPVNRETGNIQNRNRELIPRLCRFGQWDPEGYVDGLSLQQSRAANPIGRLDPVGLKWKTSNFVSHYWTGGGEEVDIGSANVNLLSDWRNAVADHLKMMENDILLEGGLLEDRPCNKEGSSDWTNSGRVTGPTFTASGTDRRHNMSDPLYSIGGSTVHADYNCIVDRKCECCSYGHMQETAKLVMCDVKWSLDDRLSNPTDKQNEHYTRDDKSYSACMAKCRQKGLECLATMYKNATKRERGRQCQRRVRSPCWRRCKEKYPSSELPLGKKYAIVATWYTVVVKIIKTPCEE